MAEDSTNVFEIVIWSGTALSVLGLLGLAWCIITVIRAKRRNLPDEEMRAVLQRVLPLNLGALLLSVLGLMLVATGVFMR